MRPLNKILKNNPKLSWIFLTVLFLGSFILLFHSILLPFIASFILAYALHPLMNYFNANYFNKQINALIIVICFFIIFLTLIFGSIPFIIQELTTLAGRFPTYATEIQNYLMPYYSTLKKYLGIYNNNKIQTNISEHFSSFTNWLFRALLNLLTGTMAVANIVSLIILTPLLTFYFLRDWSKVINCIYGLIPIYVRPNLMVYMQEIDQTLSAYLKGQILMCTTLAIYYSFCLKILGLDHAITVGSTAGFLAFIPYVGYCIGLISAIGVALIHLENWHEFIWVLVIFGGGQIIESFILLPYLIGDRVGLHGAWIIFALLAGGLLFGFWGLLLAVPLFAICRVIIKALIITYRQSYLFLGDENNKISMQTKKLT